MNEWFLYSFLTIFIWGIVGFFSKIMLYSVETNASYIIQLLGGIVLVIPWIIFFQPNFKIINFNEILYSCLLGIANCIGFFFFLCALHTGKVSIVVPLIGLYPVLTFILAIVFLKERVTSIQLIGIILAMISIILISYKR